MKKRNIVFSIIIIIIGSSLLITKKYNNNKIIEKEIKEVQVFFDSFNSDITTKSEFIAVLEIPKINLKKGLYNLNTSNNDVNKNIEILKESDMPNIPNGNLILAAHSGNSNVSFFKNLDSLIIGDEAYIYYNKTKYIYIVSDIYKVNKTGKVKIIRNKSINTLTMITCDPKDSNKQIVIISEIKKDE